jgi:hypothetical protein
MCTNILITMKDCNWGINPQNNKYLEVMSLGSVLNQQLRVWHLMTVHKHSYNVLLIVISS